MKNTTTNSIHVNENFTALDNRSLDSKGRITIPQDWTLKLAKRIRSFQIFQNGDGDLLLRPEVSIPAREAWIFENPKVLASLKRGIQDAKEGKGGVWRRRSMWQAEFADTSENSAGHR